MTSCQAEYILHTAQLWGQRSSLTGHGVGVGVGVGVRGLRGGGEGQYLQALHVLLIDLRPNETPAEHN